MAKIIDLEVGSFTIWKGKYYKVILDDLDVGCEKCALKEDCDDVPYICWYGRRKDNNDVYFKEVEGLKL